MLKILVLRFYTGKNHYKVKMVWLNCQNCIKNIEKNTIIIIEKNCAYKIGKMKIHFLGKCKIHRATF